ncbi:MAG TPA: prephenate dehydrogenase/arogenate dehydrogenase family protein [Aquificaceae bacterium]|nr:prephenate dehydrogenase/arogenate dehydrogenase family protein [Aquificaceae bacterium]
MEGSLLIVGVGFMGGSFALALREGGFRGRIYGIDINPGSLRKAKEIGVIEEGSQDLLSVVDFSPNFVVLSSPVGTFRDIALSLKDRIDPDTIVTDLGSVKGELVLSLEEILGSRFVGGHPIAGTEKAGVEFSRGDLFKGRKVILTPTTKTDAKVLETVRRLWELTGAEVELMDPFLHDRVFGAVSHLPHAVAFALIDALVGMDFGIDLFKYPGGGFKDFTRIAASDPIMWRDIFLENRENVILAIDAYLNSLKRLRELIDRGEKEELTGYLREARNRRVRIGWES